MQKLLDPPIWVRLVDIGNFQCITNCSDLTSGNTIRQYHMMGCDTSSIQYVSHVVAQSHIRVPLTNAGLQSSNMSNTKNIWSTYDDRRQIMLPMLWRSSNTSMWTHGLSRMHIDSTSKPVMWHRLYVNITCEATIQYWRACIPCSRCTVRFHIH